MVHLNLIVEDVEEKGVECPSESFDEEDEDEGLSGIFLPNLESSIAQWAERELWLKKCRMLAAIRSRGLRVMWLACIE